MKRLILMRHAKTEPFSEGVEDFGRALTERGHEDARAMAEEIVRAGWSPQRILVSTARRARETCSEVAKVVLDEKVRPMESLYLATPKVIMDAITANDDVPTLMVIGHNPGLHDLAMELYHAGGASDDFVGVRLIEKYPTACVSVFESDEDERFVPVHFKLIEVMRAKDLRPA